MSEYLLRKVKNVYEAAKFTDSSHPISVYKITSRSCSCPSFRLCKHIKILKEWQTMGEPVGVVFNDDAKIIGTLELGLVQ